MGALLSEGWIHSQGVALQVQRQTEEENAAAEAEQLHLQEEEWNMAELERIQEQQVIPVALLLSSSHCLHACWLTSADLFSPFEAAQSLPGFHLHTWSSYCFVCLDADCL